MSSKIMFLTDDGIDSHTVIYSQEPKKALVAFLRQEDGDYNFFSYPDMIDGMWESESKKGVWYYNDAKRGRTVGAFPCGV